MRRVTLFVLSVVLASGSQQGIAAEVALKGRNLEFMYRHRPPYDPSATKRIRLVEVTGDATLAPMFTDAMAAASARSISLERNVNLKAKPSPGDVDLSVSDLGCALEGKTVLLPAVRPVPVYTPPGQKRAPYTPPPRPKAETRLWLACVAKLSFHDPARKRALGSYWVRTEHRGGTFGMGLVRESSLEKLRQEIVPKLGELAALRFVARDEPATGELSQHPKTKDILRPVRDNDLPGAKAILEKHVAELPEASMLLYDLALIQRALGDTDGAMRTYRSISDKDPEATFRMKHESFRFLSDASMLLFYSVQQPK